MLLVQLPETVDALELSHRARPEKVGGDGHRAGRAWAGESVKDKECLRDDVHREDSQFCFDTLERHP
jgi:hypothetical protein